MEVNCEISDENFERFLAGTSDELIDHVADCTVCQERMEASLDESTSNYIEQTMRAIRIHSFTRDTLEAAVDVSSRFAKSALHYLMKG
jgi:hypothetical protein